MRTPPASFEAKYAEHPDPWGFASSPYEREKYARTVAALGERRFPRALELGCANGELTALLAPVCDELVAVDGAPTAAARAAARFADDPGVTVLEAIVPEALPEGPWSLVVASEILYYLGDALFDTVVTRLVADLEPGGLLLAVHWTGSDPSHVRSGEDVHARLRAAPGLAPRSGRTRPGYRLDLLERR